MSEQLKAAIAGLVVIIAIELYPPLAPLKDSIAEIVLLFLGAIAGKTAQNYAEIKASAELAKSIKPMPTNRNG
jgi:hypothetical protein